MVPNEELHILTIHFEPPNRGQPLYNEQDAWSQGVLYMEVPLYLYYSGIPRIKDTSLVHYKGHSHSITVLYDLSIKE